MTTIKVWNTRGLEDRSLLVVEEKDGEIRSRPACVFEPEIWGPEGTAYFMLINCLTKEGWDRAVPEVVAMGLDPAKISGIDADHRDTLPTDAEWPDYARRRRAELERIVHSSESV